jgi:hypothetical protein
MRELSPEEDSQLTQMTPVVLTIFNCEGYRGGVKSSLLRARKLLKEEARSAAFPSGAPADEAGDQERRL